MPSKIVLFIYRYNSIVISWQSYQTDITKLLYKNLIENFSCLVCILATLINLPKIEKKKYFRLLLPV